MSKPSPINAARIVERAAASIDAAAGAALLLEHGALILRAVVPAAVIEAVDAELADSFERTPFSQGKFYGDRTVRFGKLFARSAQAQTLAVGCLPQQIATAVLGRWHASASLNFSQAIAIHPGSPIQVPHRDGEMWPVPPADGEHLVSAMWPLTAFTNDNGATAIWPHSHRAATPLDVPVEPVQAEMQPGDVLLFLGSTLHAGRANRSDADRRGVVIGYAASWLAAAENQWLAYPPEIARTFDPALAALIGYRRHAPNLNNHDCRCPSELLSDAGPGIGAVDELAPAQLAGLDRFFAELAA
ncbi:MAG: hypothetical protein B7Y45_00890 [Sphingomonas sp. 28-66-16]|nr:MAG: hypothetical protein B7Y45_00890 [Sphingomonas sp. 28-66-16]